MITPAAMRMSSISCTRAWYRADVAAASPSSVRSHRRVMYCPSSSQTPALAPAIRDRTEEEWPCTSERSTMPEP